MTIQQMLSWSIIIKETGIFVILNVNKSLKKSSFGLGLGRKALVKSESCSIRILKCIFFGYANKVQFSGPSWGESIGRPWNPLTQGKQCQGLVSMLLA